LSAFAVFCTGFGEKGHFRMQIKNGHVAWFHAIAPRKWGTFLLTVIWITNDSEQWTEASDEVKK
jgi:hypothetical protein